MNKLKPLTNKELAFFCGQMHTIIKSGISAFEALGIMQEDAGEDDVAILQAIAEDMRENGYLAHAIAKTKMFPNYLIQMINIGETTGNLDSILEGLRDYYSREDEIQNSVKNAIVYPAVMSSVIMVIIFVLLTQVMPIFETVFNQLGTELTGIAKMLLHAGIALERYALVFVIVLCAILGFAIYCIKSPKAAHLKECFIRRNTFIRNIQCKISACHFASIMAIALHSGISADEGFAMADKVNTNTDFQQNLNLCKARIRDGSSFGMALKQSGIFTGIYSRMTTIGDRTGSLETTMAEIADMYEKDITEAIDNKIRSIEPIFILILSVVVGVILLSVMLPLLAIIAAL